MGVLKDELQGFVPTPQAAEIMKMVARGSSVLRLSKVEQMDSETKKFNVLTDGPGAYWVSEGQRIQTSKATWIYPEITAKKLAVIIPVTKEKLNDSTISVFSELKESIAEAFYKSLDAAALFGTDSPFKTNVMKGVTENGQTVSHGAASLDLDVSDAMAYVEDAGYEVSGFVAHVGIKNALRKLRDGDGNQLLVPGVNGGEFYNAPIEFVRNGAFDRRKADILAGEWKYSLVGVRQGIEYEVLREATLQGTLGEDGKPISLAEQDMVAIKATMRVGYLVVKPEAFAAVAPTEKLGELTVASAEGTAAGKTRLTVTPAKGSGNSYRIKVANNPSLPALGSPCKSGYADWNGTDEVEAEAGQKLVVAEMGANGKCVKAGMATAIVKF